MSRYASTTNVPVEKSRQEIETVLRRYGAEGFLSGWEVGRAVVGFKAKGRHIRIVVPLPLEKDYKWKWGVTDKQKAAHLDQAARQRFRALLLVIKAKLETVESGIATFDGEFLPYVVLPNGQTVAEAILPQIAETYATGRMPPLLALGPASSD